MTLALGIVTPVLPMNPRFVAAQLSPGASSPEAE
jgi:hypothetical protein